MRVDEEPHSISNVAEGQPAASGRPRSVGALLVAAIEYFGTRTFTKFFRVEYPAIVAITLPARLRDMLNKTIRLDLGSHCSSSPVISRRFSVSDGQDQASKRFSAARPASACSGSRRSHAG